MIVAALLVQSALADGDPASDYLISQQVFVPFQGVSTKAAGEITALLADSKQKGFPLKVAVISSREDLGSVPSLFGKPGSYASFLGQEDYYFFKDELLVVMPNGYGLYKHAGVPAADKAAIKALPPPGTAKGDPLVAAAMHAVRVLAARHGVTLSAARARAGVVSDARSHRDHVRCARAVCARDRRSAAAAPAGAPVRRAAIVLVLVACCAGCGGAAKPVFNGTELTPPSAAPNFALHDQDGRTVTVAGQRGHWTVVTFLYTQLSRCVPADRGQPERRAAK